MNEFLKRFEKFDYHKFNNLAIRFIETCDQGGLYHHFVNCYSEEDVNQYVYELYCEYPDMFE